MEALKILSQLKNIIWGTPTLALLLSLGVYFTLKSGFYRKSAIKKTITHTLGSLKQKGNGGISPFAAVATALGGTVGIGSIVGMGYAVSAGGAGSIFWMWVCSFFGMGLKYAEVRIALNRPALTKQGRFGGAPFRLGEMGYKKTALLFCLLCLAVSFFTGNLTQTGVMYEFFESIGASKLFSALLCLIIIGIALFGGRKRIAAINSFIVPAFSAVYLLCALCIIILNFKNLGSAISAVFSQAFGFRAISGGFSGAVLAQVIREGFARSLFSNEAGMGSSPLAHATGNTSPAVQGEWGIFEIFFDTFIISTATALCLLSSNSNSVPAMFLSTFGNMGVYLFGTIISVFAFASVISWCYYGECCIAYMFKSPKIPSIAYRVIFAAVTLLGGFISNTALWDIADILNALMMFPNLFLLFKCRNEIERMV